MQRIVVTGSSGYYGRRLVRHIRESAPEIRILGLDVAAPSGPAPHEFSRMDMRDPALRDIVAEFRPDTIVHLAFVVNPIHDETRMHDINVNGTRNVLQAAHAVGPERILISSSATAFGARPENPLPIDDDWPVRAEPNFTYSYDKAQVEGLASAFADRHPQIAVSWTRPSIIYGPGVDNYLSRMLLNHPVVVLPDGCNVPQQFVHEDDVAAATWCILRANGRGPFNLGPPDWIGLTDVARESGRPTVRVPLWLMNLATRFCWGLRLPLLPFPPGMNAYVRYPWIVAPRRLCSELKFQFRFSTLGTLRALLRARTVTHDARSSCAVLATDEGKRAA